MTSNKQFQFLVRAPANRAPSRTLRSATCGGEAARSGSTPIGDRARSKFSHEFSGGRSVPATGQSVTHVLNQKCYLCFDQTPRCQMKNAQCSMLNGKLFLCGLCALCGSISPAAHQT